MKNKSGHTPVIKAFAGGVHVAVIRYVVGVQDGNVDPIKCGVPGADLPSLLSRQLATDGIALNPPPTPPPEEEGEAETKEKSGGLFTCGEDNADEDVEPVDSPRELEEETKNQENFFASNGVPYPVFVPPGPSSQGHRRMARFVDTMQNAVWGFDPEQVFVLTKPAVLAQSYMPTFKEAQEHHLLEPMSSLPPAAKVLYVSHRWAGLGEPDTQDAHAFMQVQRYLKEHSGDNIQYIWIDVSCMDVGNRDNVRYEQYMSNVMTVLARSTHMLAVPPCKTLDPRALVRDMAVARLMEKQTAEGKTPEYLVSAALKTKGDEAVVKAIEEEVDAAILSRQLSHPDKWSSLVVDSSNGAGGGGAEGEEEGGQGAGGVPASGGGAGIPPRPSTGGGALPPCPPMPPPPPPHPRRRAPAAGRAGGRRGWGRGSLRRWR
ncbi:unnamed protein product [Ectocarpus fasciculatus]